MNAHHLIPLLLTAASLSAQSFPQAPAGLAPGDSYRLLVVTASQRDATSADIADYDAFVQADIAAGPLAQLGLNWRALASTPTVNADDHTDTDPHDNVNTGVPIYLPDGTLLAVDNLDLWNNGIANAPNIDSFGNPPTASRVWTGTHSYWGGAIAPLGNTDPSHNGSSMTGSPTANGQIWMLANFIPQSTLLPLYALSDVITVAGHAERLGTPAMPDAFKTPLNLPVIGTTYAPLIDHDGFVEDALLDVVFYGATQINVPLPGFGTVLIDNIFGSQSYVPTTAAGGPPQAYVAFAIPDDPDLLGVEVSAQVLALDSAFALHLTNAIDFVVGSN